MAPITAFCIASEFWSLAGLVFFTAVLTDLIDGPLARHRGEASRQGGLIDPGLFHAIASADDRVGFPAVHLRLRCPKTTAAQGKSPRTLQRHFVFCPCRHTGHSTRARIRLDTRVDCQLRWVVAYRIDHLFDL